jgi:hypothetical protein
MRNSGSGSASANARMKSAPETVEAAYPYSSCVSSAIGSRDDDPHKKRGPDSAGTTLRPIILKISGHVIMYSGAIAWASSENGLVLIIIVPHCTQVWVTSSKSFDAAPLPNGAGATAVIASRLPQCRQGRRKLGRCDRATSL